MFCPNCGTQVQDNAKFCYMCGTKLGNNSNVDTETKINEIRNDDLVEEYTEQIQNDVLEAYLNGEKILPTYFYGKSSLYDMTQDEVDKVFNQKMKVIEHLNDYIKSILGNGEKYLTETYCPDDYENYASMLGVETDLSRKFWNNYVEKNEINEKQRLLSYIIEQYGETGEILKEIPEEYRNIRSVSLEELLERYKKIILQVELLLEYEYAKNNNDELTDEQCEELADKLVKQGLLEEHLKDFIRGYEKKSGIESRKKDQRRTRVLERVTAKYARNYTIVSKNVEFGAKYFLKIRINSFLNESLKQFKTEYENMSKTSNSAIGNLIDIFERYISNFSFELSEIEKLFEIGAKKIYVTQCESLFNYIGTMIVEIGEEFGDLEVRNEIEKRMRQESAANRGRWQGGGFGVSGAIKGAVTASAMNAVTGLAYAGAGLVGNAVSGLGSMYGKQKAIKKIKDIFPALENMNEKITEQFMIRIHEEYPELYFDPWMADSPEEQRLRKGLLHVMISEEKKRVIINELLEINPANWRNGVIILVICAKYPKFMDDDTAKAFEEIEDFFGWTDHFNREIYEVKSVLYSNQEKIQAWDSVDEKVYNRTKELCELAEKFYRATGDENELSKDLRYIETNFELMNKINDFNSSFVKAREISKEDLVEIGNGYCIANECIPAKKIFLEATGNNELFSKLLDLFYEKNNKDMSRLMNSMHEFMKTKAVLESGDYEKALYILAKIENQSGKTMLIYAAEKHDELVIKELIKYDADIELLKKKIDTTYVANEKEDANTELVRNSKSCPFCGKMIQKTAKFCNYCGGKIMNGGDFNEM